MKSKKNLTRYTYETTSFEGWRLSFSRAGCQFTKYFSDRKYGGPKKSLKMAEESLDTIKEMVGNSRLVEGKLSKNTQNKVKKLLKDL